ncbi:MAG: hypothetical protein KDJ43_12215 [Rhizobiaceae bacterium]|nr:hypothetical protein [Rhizobiaceae bacterium]
MSKFIDLTGQRFGKLTVIEQSGKTKHGATLWRLTCDCGGETTAHTGELRAGRRKACKCGLSQPKHGMRNTRLYRVWTAMKVRCTSEKHPRYHRYGGRGISVCESWQEFEPFAEWALANGYRDDLQIDRINNDGSYEPDNCRFVTAAENMANRSCSKPSQLVH